MLIEETGDGWSLSEAWRAPSVGSDGTQSTAKASRAARKRAGPDESIGSAQLATADAKASRRGWQPAREPSPSREAGIGRGRRPDRQPPAGLTPARRILLRARLRMGPMLFSDMPTALPISW